MFFTFSRNNNSSELFFVLPTYREVYSDDVSEPLLVVEECGEVGDKHNEGGGDIHGHEVTEDVPLEDNLDRDALHAVDKSIVGNSGGEEIVSGGKIVTIFEV